MHKYFLFIFVIIVGMINMRCSNPSVMQLNNGVKIQWLGHSAFRIESPKGKVILIDPWLQNPKAPAGMHTIAKADLILITNGHDDHIGNTIDLQKITGAKVVCVYEIGLYLAEQGINNLLPMDIGGTYEFEGITIHMVPAMHSSGIIVGGKVLPGGAAAGFVIQLENGFTIYHAGATGLFGDMRLIGEYYKPDVAFLPIGGLETMGSKDAAKASELILARYFVPMQYGTFSTMTGTPAEYRSALRGDLQSHVVELTPGVVWQ